jgi:hypothetical protein
MILFGDRDSAAHSTDVMQHRLTQFPVWLVAAALLGSTAPSFAQPASDEPVELAAATSPAIEAYIRARTAYEQEAEAYWQSIADKRRARFAKRRSGEPIGLDDYVLAQPPVYAGPPPPPGYVPPRRDPDRPPVPIPTIPEFLQAAAQQYNFVPDRPKTEADFKAAYAKVAAAAGLTREQAVRIYAFETGGNGGYDSQAGLVPPRKDARPISPAIGYNQLLSTNTVSLLAEHGDKFLTALSLSATRLVAAERKAMDRKIAALQKMVAFSRTVPNAWSEHDKLAKFTEGGKGTHAALLDRDIGPLLQTQKLLNSVVFARAKGLRRPLTAAELELMNFTGDGNGFDMVTMPQALRERVPTSNFFQRGGYERNPIARRTGTVAALFDSIDSKMDRASQLPGAKELAEAF